MPHNDEGSSSGEDFWRRILNDTSSYPLSDTHSLHQSNMSTSDTDQNGIIEHSTGSPQQPAMASLEAAVSEVRGFQTAAQALPNGDITTHDDFEVIAQLDVPIIEDVPAELEEFVRLTKHRVPGEAMLFFNDVLVRHMRHFPVIAELADFLLEDGCYSKLETVSGGVLAEWERDPTANSSEVTVEEKALLRLYHAYARIKTKGLLNEAVDLTKALHNSIPSGGEQPSDVQLQILVLRHLILDIALRNSHLVTLNDAIIFKCSTDSHSIPSVEHSRWVKRQIFDALGDDEMHRAACYVMLSSRYILPSELPTILNEVIQVLKKSKNTSEEARLFATIRILDICLDICIESTASTDSPQLIETIHKCDVAYEIVLNRIQELNVCSTEPHETLFKLKQIELDILKIRNGMTSSVLPTADALAIVDGALKSNLDPQVRSRAQWIALNVLQPTTLLDIIINELEPAASKDRNFADLLSLLNNVALRIVRREAPHTLLRKLLHCYSRFKREAFPTSNVSSQQFWIPRVNTAIERWQSAAIDLLSSDDEPGSSIPSQHPDQYPLPERSDTHNSLNKFIPANFVDCSLYGLEVEKTRLKKQLAARSRHQHEPVPLTSALDQFPTPVLAYASEVAAKAKIDKPKEPMTDTVEDQQPHPRPDANPEETTTTEKESLQSPIRVETTSEGQASPAASNPPENPLNGAKAQVSRAPVRGSSKRVQIVERGERAPPKNENRPKKVVEDGIAGSGIPTVEELESSEPQIVEVYEEFSSSSSDPSDTRHGRRRDGRKNRRRGSPHRRSPNLSDGSVSSEDVSDHGRRRRRHGSPASSGSSVRSYVSVDDDESNTTITSVMSNDLKEILNEKVQRANMLMQSPNWMISRDLIIGLLDDAQWLFENGTSKPQGPSVHSRAHTKTEITASRKKRAAKGEDISAGIEGETNKKSYAGRWKPQTTESAQPYSFRSRSGPATAPAPAPAPYAANSWGYQPASYRAHHGPPEPPQPGGYFFGERNPYESPEQFIQSANAPFRADAPPTQPVPYYPPYGSSGSNPYVYGSGPYAYPPPAHYSAPPVMQHHHYQPYGYSFYTSHHPPPSPPPPEPPIPRKDEYYEHPPPRPSAYNVADNTLDPVHSKDIDIHANRHARQYGEPQDRERARTEVHYLRERPPTYQRAKTDVPLADDEVAPPGSRTYRRTTTTTTETFEPRERPYRNHRDVTDEMIRDLERDDEYEDREVFPPRKSHKFTARTEPISVRKEWLERERVRSRSRERDREREPSPPDYVVVRRRTSPIRATTRWDRDTLERRRERSTSSGVTRRKTTGMNHSHNIRIERVKGSRQAYVRDDDSSDGERRGRSPDNYGRVIEEVE